MAEAKYASKNDPAVAGLIDTGHSLQEEYQDLLDRRDINREGLRALVAAGMASKEQAAMIDELYPPRKRTKDKIPPTTEPAAAAA